MFKSISWQEFLNALMVAHAGYYVLAVVLLYSKDIYRWLIKKPEQNPTPNEVVNKKQSGLMGQVKSEPPRKNEQSVDAQDVIINSEPEQVHDEDAMLVGSVSDLLHEVKILARVIKESGGSKEEGAPMFQSLLSNYSHLVTTKYQESVSLFIQEHCRSEGVFELSLQEVRSWWPVSASQNNQQNNYENENEQMDSEG